MADLQLVRDKTGTTKLHSNIPASKDENTCLLTRYITQSLKRMIEVHDNRPETKMHQQKLKKQKIMEGTRRVRRRRGRN